MMLANERLATLVWDNITGQKWINELTHMVTGKSAAWSLWGGGAGIIGQVGSNEPVGV